MADVVQYIWAAVDNEFCDCSPKRPVLANCKRQAFLLYICDIPNVWFAAIKLAIENGATTSEPCSVCLNNWPNQYTEWDIF